jgi:hypothetical protein
MRARLCAKAGSAFPTGPRTERGLALLRTAVVACLLSLTGCAIPRALLQVGPEVRFIKADIPLTFTGYGARYPVVTVRIQGRRLRLLLDTGSPDEAVGLSREAAAELDVCFTGKSRVYRDAYGGCYQSREFVIPSIELGNLELTGVVCNERPTNVYGLDGAVGLELLSRFDVLIDYEGRVLRLFRRNRTPDFLADEEWHRHGYERGLCVSIEFDFLDGRHELQLDSGCGCNFVAGTSDLGRGMRSALGDNSWTVPLGGGTTRYCPSYRIKRHYLGDHDIGGGQFVLGDLPPHLGNGVLGYDFFASNLVYIRFSKKEIWLKRVVQTPPAVVYGGVPSASHNSASPVSAFGHSGGLGAPGGVQSAPSSFAVPH